MVADGDLTETERNALFLRGMHKDFRKRIKGALIPTMKARGAQWAWKTPPTMDEVMAAAREVFHPDNMDNTFSDSSSDDSDTEDSDSDEDSSSESDSSSDSDTDSDGGRPSFWAGNKKKKSSSKKSSRSSSKKSKKRKGKGKGKERDEMAELTAKVEKLLSQPPQASAFAAYVPGQSQPPTRPSSAFGPRKCFMCGKAEGVDLDHSIGMRYCPETYKLINEGLVRYAPEGKMLVADGKELPRYNGHPAGIAGQLRDESSGHRGRQTPPHVSTTASASCYSIGLYCSGTPYLAAGSTVAYTTAAVTRSQTKGADSDDEAVRKRVRFDRSAHERRESVTDTEGPSTTSWRKSSPKPPYQPSADRTTHDSVPSTSGGRPSSATPHVSNLREGWNKSRLESRARIEEVTDDDAVKKPVKPGPRFTSAVKESISFDDLETQMLDSKVAITLRQLLASSPDLARRMRELVKTRREFAIAAADAVAESSVVSATIEPVGSPEPTSDSVQPSQTATMTWDRVREQPEQVCLRYADAVIATERRHFAIVAGHTRGLFGDQPVIFLVDSGSELNLISQHVWERCMPQPPIDEDGQRWSLKGIGGEDVPLIGCCRNAPVQLDGKNFDHHFFVTPRRHPHYDGILGQPWFSWYSAVLKYQRDGDAFLHAYVSGDQAGASVTVRVVQQSDSRNTDRLVMAAVSQPPGF